MKRTISLWKEQFLYKKNNFFLKTTISLWKQQFLYESFWEFLKLLKNFRIKWFHFTLPLTVSEINANLCLHIILMLWSQILSLSLYISYHFQDKYKLIIWWSFWYLPNFNTCDVKCCPFHSISNSFYRDNANFCF